VNTTAPRETDAGLIAGKIIAQWRSKAFRRLTQKSPPRSKKRKRISPKMPPLSLLTNDPPINQQAIRRKV